MREFLRLHVGRFLRDQGGNFATLTAVAMFPALVAASVAIDYTNASLTTERMQVALDDATLVAARHYGEGHSEAEATTLANEMFFANFADAGKPSLHIVYSKAGQQVTATADYSSNYNPIFLKRASFPIASHSSTVYQAGQEACILALNPTADRAFEVSGNSNVDTSLCAVTANSRSSQAIYVGGSSTLKSECLYTPGKVSAAPNKIALLCEKAREGASAVADPFASRALPKAGSVVDLKNKASGDLKPGTYQGLDVRGTVTLQPGDYIIDGGKLSFAGQSVITGKKVTFFLLNGAEVDIHGGTTFDVTAPTTGPWAGFSIVADRSNTASAVINGNSNSKLSGIIYMPAAKEIRYSGNGTTYGDCVRIIAQTIVMTGNSKFKLDCKSEVANNEINNPGAIRLVQ